MNNSELCFINKYIVKEKKIYIRVLNLKERSILRFLYNINSLIKAEKEYFYLT